MSILPLIDFSLSKSSTSLPLCSILSSVAVVLGTICFRSLVVLLGATCCQRVNVKLLCFGSVIVDQLLLGELW